jgi:hypothetical protein
MGGPSSLAGFHAATAPPAMAWPLRMEHHSAYRPAIPRAGEWADPEVSHMTAHHSQGLRRAFWATFASGCFVLFAVSGLMQAAGQQQQQQQEQQQQQPPLKSGDVKDEELKNFIRSLDEVKAIQKQLEQKLATVDEPAEAQKLQQEANAKMVAVVRGCKLDADRFNRLTRSISTDPELAQRFQDMNAALREADEFEPCLPGGGIV